LISIQLYNFRQFYQKTPEIKFSYGDRNITVIHANNGSGKTAILNAFTWTLFDTTTPGFQLKDQIVNKRAIREATQGDAINAWVEIKFEHEGKKYTVKREKQVNKVESELGWLDSNIDTPSLHWAGPEGKIKHEENVKDTIGRILPKDLHSYFFFDGERIERIVQPEKEQRAEIKKAAKKLLGIEVIERASQHIDKARKELEKELKKVGDSETTKKLEEKEEIEKEIGSRTNRNSEIDSERQSLDASILEIEKRLSQHKDAREIQERRDKLKLELDSTKDNYKNSESEISDLISKKGFKIFLKEPVEIFNKQLDMLRQKGELPSGIKRQFVEDLLAKNTCICGASLTNGTNERTLVENWRAQAGMVDVEEKALRIGGEISNFEDSIKELSEELKKLQIERGSFREEISKIENELDDIKQKLKASPREEISNLEQRRSQLEQNLDELQNEQITNDALIGDRNSRRDKIENEIQKHQSNEKKQILAQARVKAAIDARNRLDKMLKLFDIDFRIKLNDHIKQLFSKISLTPYSPEIFEDYSIRLQESAGGQSLQVAASQGENQILSLAFIGSIIEIVREYNTKKKQHLPGPDASNYPLVMDSPFGSLDHNYRYQIAKHLPLLANQIVVLVSKTQWRGEVEDEMKAKVGSSYVLTYYSPKEDVKKDEVTINGHNYTLVMPSPNEFEYTEIMELNHGG